MAEKVLRFHQRLFDFQVFQLLSLLVTGTIVLIINKANPGFFPYKYLKWSLNGSEIIRFWPMFLYAAFMAALKAILSEKTNEENKIFAWSTATDIMAGVWEEIGYRYLYICTAMMILTFFNTMFSWVAGILILVTLTFLAIHLINEKGRRAIMFCIPLIIIAILLAYACFQSDPMFWIYRKIVAPLTNLITLGQFQEIFYNGYPELFVFGMILANSWFKDGHKYQGPIGIANSWVIGFVMMYAMLNFGLLTAIALHIIYDFEFTVIRFLVMACKKNQ